MTLPPPPGATSPGAPIPSLARLEACVPALRRYALALLRDRQDADDLVHDTLVQGLSHLHTSHAGPDLRPWLFTIMHNLFISQKRRARVRGEGTSLTAAAQDIGTAATQEDRLHWRDLMSALDRIPADQRAVIILVSVEGLTYAAVGDVLGIPLGTVMSRLFRGREKLRQIMAGGQPPPRRVT
jgi:RNA polymerase sigma-70 factor, ECF subfamily